MESAPTGLSDEGRSVYSSIEFRQPRRTRVKATAVRIPHVARQDRCDKIASGGHGKVKEQNVWLRLTREFDRFCALGPTGFENNSTTKMQARAT
jgi:hypothetical protein